MGSVPLSIGWKPLQEHVPGDDCSRKWIPSDTWLLASYIHLLFCRILFGFVPKKNYLLSTFSPLNGIFPRFWSSGWSKLDQIHSTTVCQYDYGWQHAGLDGQLPYLNSHKNGIWKGPGFQGWHKASDRSLSQEGELLPPLLAWLSWAPMRALSSLRRSTLAWMKLYFLCQMKLI